MREQCLDLGPKQQRPAIEAVIQRLDPKPVARDKEPAFPSIPDRKRVHSAQVLNAVTPMLFIEVNDGLGVAVSPVTMPASFQAFAQFLVVVEFAVVDDPDVVLFVADGLVTGLDIDDAQPAHGQSDVSFHEEAIVIGAAMNDLLIHTGERFPLSPASIGVENPANSAHVYTPIRRGSSSASFPSMGSNVDSICTR